MMPLCKFFAATALSLLAVSASAQTAEPGTSSTEVTPASATPQAQTQPDLRTDSMPHTYQDASTDSEPDNLGVDATPIMDLGWDWSLPQDSNQPSVLKRIVTRKGQVSIVEVQTQPAVPLAVVNPPGPPSHVITGIPKPAVELKPTPPNPLAGIPQ